MPRKRLFDDKTFESALVDIAEGVQLATIIERILTERDEELNATNKRRVRDALDYVNPNSQKFDNEKWGEIYDQHRLDHLTNIEDQLRLELSQAIKDLPTLRKKAVNGTISMIEYKNLVASIVELQRFLGEKRDLDKESGVVESEPDKLPETEEDKLLEMHTSESP